jgi:hypothetical protein
MRVLFYHGDSQWSGPARAMFVAARGLSARGHSVTVACCTGSRLDTLLLDAGVETIGIDLASNAAAGAWNLRRVIKEKFIEVVIVSSERDQLVVSSARMFADRGAVLRRVPSFERLEMLRSGKLALRMASSGVVVSTRAEADALDSAGWVIPPAVAPIGVDVTAYDDIQPATNAELGAPPNTMIVGCAYDPSGRYRIATVFRTIALLAPRHHMNVHVAVFGPGSADDGLRMHASALGVGSLVSFLGETRDDRRVMRAATVGWVVAGSDAAAFGCLDFMSLRIPVITDRSPLSQHYVADAITGVLLSAGDPSYTASSVSAFVASKERLAAMGNAARTRVQREFPESAMIDGFEQAVNAAGDRTKWASK